MKTSKSKVGEKYKKLTKTELALITLASYLENPMHDQYKIKQHILEILELKEVGVLEV